MKLRGSLLLDHSRILTTIFRKYLTISSWYVFIHFSSSKSSHELYSISAIKRRRGKAKKHGREARKGSESQSKEEVDRALDSIQTYEGGIPHRAFVVRGSEPFGV